MAEEEQGGTDASQWGSVNDDYTGNDGVGQARQLGDDFWQIETAQAKYWNSAYTMANLHAEESMLVQAGALANGYVENSSLAAALMGLSFEFKTPVVATVNVLPGSKIDVDIMALEASTNRALLRIGHMKANDALEAEELLSECKAMVSHVQSQLTGLKTGATEATIAEQIRI